MGCSACGMWRELGGCGYPARTAGFRHSNDLSQWPKAWPCVAVFRRLLSPACQPNWAPCFAGGAAMRVSRRDSGLQWACGRRSAQRAAPAYECHTRAPPGPHHRAGLLCSCRCSSLILSCENKGRGVTRSPLRHSVPLYTANYPIMHAAGWGGAGCSRQPQAGPDQRIAHRVHKRPHARPCLEANSRRTT